MARAARVLGRALVTLGAVLLLVAAYQVWGTDILQRREQQALRREFETRSASVAAAESQVVAVPGGGAGGPGTSESPGRPGRPRPALGEALGVFSIPALGVEQVLVEGVGREQLKTGPGHYPHSVLPGYRGNAAIAGHRTTYGAPFNRIDELRPGDVIRIRTLEGTFTYRVTGHRIVAPDDVSVVMPTEDPRLTLTTCHPKTSARQRLVVTASLVREPIDEARPEIPGPPAGSRARPS